MAILYKIFGIKNPQDPESDEKYYARTISAGKVDIEDLCRDINMITHINKADLVKLFVAMKQVIAERLLMGYTIDLMELAIFSPAITSEGVANPKKFRRSHIKRIKVNVRAKKQLNLEIANAKLQRIKN